MAVLGPIGISNVGFFWAPTRLEADAARADSPSGPGTPVVVTVDDAPPQQAIKYVAAIAAVFIADFVSPPSAPARAAVISAAWAPADPAPQRPNENTAPFAVAAQIDVPPGAGVPKIVILPDDPLPQVNAKLPQTYVAGVPFTRHLEVLGAWAPITFSVTSQAKIATIAPAYPPPLVRHPEIIAAWVAPPPSPILPPKEAAFAPSVDNPPLFKRSQDWTPWDTAVAVKLVVSSAATAVTPSTSDNPPFTSRPRTPDWFHWYDAVPVKLVVSCAATAGAAVTPPAGDNPPFGLHRFTAWAWGPLVAYPGGGGEFIPTADQAPVTRPWLDIVVRAWSPADPLPTLTKKLPQAGPVIVPDNPAARGVPRIVTVPDDPLPTLTKKLPQGAPPDLHDQPPFTQRRTQDWTHWFQPYPLPTLRILQTPPSGPEVITPPPIVTPPGGAGVRVGPYKQFKLKKKRKHDQCEELLEYLRSLPPAEAEAAVAEFPPRYLSLLDGLPLPHALILPAAARDAIDEDDEDECALLLELLLR